MRILLFCDDYYHPGQVPIQGVKPLESKGFSFDIITDASEFDPSKLCEYSVLIISKCDHVSKEDQTSWKTEAVQDSFIKYVENGGGLLVTHNGTVAGDNTSKLDELIGCRFAFHPNNCPVTVGVIKPHPITEGVDTFCETDEHYQLEILSDDIDILMAGYAAACGDSDKYASEPYFNFPAALAASCYVRTQKEGRVCVFTPGHTLEVWLNPSFQKVLENALRWCAGDGF